VKASESFVKRTILDGAKMIPDLMSSERSERELLVRKFSNASIGGFE
jgi:hypothetical protein